MLLVILVSLFQSPAFSQHYADTTTLPQIKINSLNGYGPYIIGAKRSNLFMVYNLPDNTNKVIMKMIDDKGSQIDEAYTQTGSNISTAAWGFESDTINFPLSPRLQIELHYQDDSIAVYKIPYTVYPDTLQVEATAGWGPFLSNNYTFSDTLWQPAPAIENTFSVSILPPRTDTVEFKIFDTDSTVISSHIVTATPGNYLDSVTYSNVQMDNLPINTDHLDIIVRCEGGPKKGLHYPKSLSILPQKPVLEFKSPEQSLTDSIGVFTQNQLSGQSMSTDSVMHAQIQNGPGQRDFSIYPGPYSVDLLKSSYSFEAWIKFDFEQLTGDYKTQTIMMVDSVFDFYLGGDSQGNYLLCVQSLSNMSWRELWTVDFSKSLLGDEQWHHIAFTCFYDQANYPTGKFYIDGNELPDIFFNQFNYDNILQHSALYYLLRKTQPLYIGNHLADNVYLFAAIDEVRIWSKALTHQEIINHNRHAPLQQPSLEGYWNFDDLRNRHNIISDKSYNNNMGVLQRGAILLPQHPAIQLVIDTLIIKSSSEETDSVEFQFLDRNHQIIDRQISMTENSITRLEYDFASLPYNINTLKVVEHYNPKKPDGLETEYPLLCLAPPPIATPQYNWNKYFSTPADMAKTYCPVMVSNFPDYTGKVTLGLKKGDEYFDTISFTETSIPYQHSLTLNGDNNYIETSSKIDAPVECTMMFWMKTTTRDGGSLMSFGDKQNGNSVTNYDREIILKPDGSIQCILQTPEKTINLYGLNINNDGEWHHIALAYGINTSALLYVDGSLVDDKYISEPLNFQGWWILGKNIGQHQNLDEKVATYFEGSFSEIRVFDRSLTYDEINAIRFAEGPQPDQSLYYKLNEGAGTSITDFAGSNNGSFKGNTPVWLTVEHPSYLIWNKNVQHHDPGTYTFFARVFYPEGPDDGVEYELGNFLVEDPYPGTTFNFSLSLGQGYFNEGTALTNELWIYSDTTYEGQNGWEKNFIGYRFYTSDHELIGEDYTYYTSPPGQDFYLIDMGDAPPGSYLSIESGFKSYNNLHVTFNTDAVPIYIHPIIPPKIYGNPGPFTQAIAPGTMQHFSDYTITMEPLTDLTKVKLVYTNSGKKEIGTVDAQKVSDTLWTASYDMASLSPPVTYLKVEYYLGTNPHPAAVEGPFPVTIQRTRPRWFDFVDDDDFTNIEQNGNQVSFKISTPFEKSWLIDNFVGVEIPEWTPMLGGMESKIKSPKVNAELVYYVSEDSLALNGTPEFYNSLIPLGFGTSSIVRFNFNNSQNNSYFLDDDDNLIAIQNYYMGGGAVSDFLVFDDVVQRIAQIFDAAETVEPLADVIKPSFKFAASVQFEYASRLRLQIDTLTGKWGSIGNLKIDANPNHTHAYENSSSYHFYSGSFGIELSLGAELLDGLVSGYFGIDGRVALGYGHSYYTIPNKAMRPLKSADFQIYGRFYIDALWGWYEKNLWGPKMFYSYNFWGDDLSDCFPPIDSKYPALASKSTFGEMPNLTGNITPVSWFTKMNQPVPYPALATSDDKCVFTWIERGKEYGERSTKVSYLDKNTGKFTSPQTISINNHAQHNPVSECIDENLMLLTWAQSRHDPKSFGLLKQEKPLEDFARSLDIWFAIYDLENATTLQLEAITDDFSGRSTGRAEANPKIVVLSKTKALLAWQVSNLQSGDAELWFSIIEKQGEQWTHSTPQVMVQTGGAKTQLQLAAFNQGKAMLTWIELCENTLNQKKLLYSIYDGSWSEPLDVIVFEENQSPNYYNMQFTDDLGGIVITSYIDDGPENQYEDLSLLTWNGDLENWRINEKTVLLIDTLHHLQYPALAINSMGKATIAYKKEKIIPKDTLSMISRIDVITGLMNDNSNHWTPIPGTGFICDTSHQIKALALSYANNDTLLMLTNEFPMTATNASFVPNNARMFGDPYMNLVLRSFVIDDDGNIEDVDEDGYFVGIDESYPPAEINIGLKCYPNPCSNYTTITFNMEEPAQVSIDIFDMNGKLVCHVAKQKLPQGAFQTIFDVSTLEAGIYTCVLTGGNHQSSIKLSVTR